MTEEELKKEVIKQVKEACKELSEKYDMHISLDLHSVLVMNAKSKAESDEMIRLQSKIRLPKYISDLSGIDEDLLGPADDDEKG